MKNRERLTRNKSEVFSVRSAYFLQLEIERKSTGNKASSSNPARLHSFWNGIWSAQVPPKIKTFIWRACNDSLLTRTKLFERKVLHSFSCVLCFEEAETCDHLFLECSFAQAVWLQSPLSKDEIHWCNECCPLEIICCCLWYIVHSLLDDLEMQEQSRF